MGLPVIQRIIVILCVLVFACVHLSAFLDIRKLTFLLGVISKEREGWDVGGLCLKLNELRLIFGLNKRGILKLKIDV